MLPLLISFAGISASLSIAPVSKPCSSHRSVKAWRIVTVLVHHLSASVKLPLEMGVLSFVQNVDKELRNGGKASTCGIHAGI